MRIFLQQRPTSAEATQFVQLVLQPDMFGGWTLMRESGRIGGRSQLKREQFLSHAEANAAFEKARDTQLKRGLQIMFVQGADAPKPDVK